MCFIWVKRPFNKKKKTRPQSSRTDFTQSGLTSQFRTWPKPDRSDPPPNTRSHWVSHREGNVTSRPGVPDTLTDQVGPREQLALSNQRKTQQNNNSYKGP